MNKHTFNTIWYLSRENHVNEMRLPAFDDVGQLIITKDLVKYQGKKYQKVEIPKSNVKFISMGKQGRDFVNNWVKIIYIQQDKVRTAFFADGSKLGYGGFLGGTQKIIQVLENSAYSIQENKDFDELRLELQKMIWRNQTMPDKEASKYDFRGAQFAGGFAETVQGSQTGGTQYNFASEQKKTLAEAASEIQNLLKHLEKTNPTATEAEQEAFVTTAISPTLRKRTVNALKAGGQVAIEEFLDNPYVNVAMAIIEGWQNIEEK